jgi:hypothetical protein
LAKGIDRDVKRDYPFLGFDTTRGIFKIPVLPGRIN